MATIGRLAIDLMARTGQLETGLKSAGNATSRFAQKANRDLESIKSPKGMFGDGIVGGLGKLGLAAFGATTALNFFGSAADEALSARKAERKLEQVFRSTGNAAGIATEQVQEFAAAREAVTNFEGDETVNAAALLGSFTNIKGDMFFDALKSAQDLAAFLDQDLTSSVMQVGKALNDPMRGLTSLTKAGIQFSESQKQVIQSLVEAGKIVEAQQMIMKEFSVQFGGQAEATSDGVSRLKNAWGNLKEELGKPLGDGAALLTPVIKAVTFLTEGVNEGIEAFKQLGLTAGDALAQATAGRGLAGGVTAKSGGAFGVGAAAVQAMKNKKDAEPKVEIKVEAAPPKVSSPVSGIGAIETKSAEGFNNLQRAIQQQGNQTLQEEKLQTKKLEETVSQLKRIERAIDRPNTEIEFV